MQAARDVGIAVERCGDEALALRDAGLLQVAAIGAQDPDLPRRRARRSGQARCSRHCRPSPPPDRQEHFLEQRAAVGEIDRRSEGVLELHVVDEDRAVRGRSPTSKVRSLMTLKPMFSSTGTRRDSATGAAVMVDLQRSLLGRLAGVAVVVDGDRLPAPIAAMRRGIGQRLRRREAAAIAFGKPRGDAGQRGVGAGAGRRLAQRVLPGADDVADRLLRSPPARPSASCRRSGR